MSTFPSDWDWHNTTLSLVRTDSTEAVVSWGDMSEEKKKKVEFQEKVVVRIYEVERKMKPHRSWKKPKIITSSNYGIW